MKVFYDERFDCGAAPLTSTTKQKKVVKAATDRGFIKLTDFMTVKRLVVGGVPLAKALGLAHDKAYIEAVLTGEPQGLAESQGFRWSRNFAESVMAVNAAYGQALLYALTTGAPVTCCPVSGAHHAHRNRGAGFCTFNYLAWAPLLAMNQGKLKKVAILDFDAHYGDGTAAIVGEDKRFDIFDITGGDMNRVHHVRPGVWEACVPDGNAYIDMVERLPGFLKTSKPDIVLYQAGMDPFEGDHVGGIPGMDALHLAQRDEIVFDTCKSIGIPVLWNLAGGYSADCDELHVGTFQQAAKVYRTVAVK